MQSLLKKVLDKRNPHRSRKPYLGTEQSIHIIQAHDLLPEAHEKNPPVVSLASCLAGFLLIFIITGFLKI
jgi:hypothetical protein